MSKTPNISEKIDHKEEIYHIFEQEAVRRNKRLTKRKDSIREDTKTVPIFAMTANAFAEDREKTRAAGMNEHLAKPLDPKLLLSKIVQYCRPQTAM